MTEPPSDPRRADPGRADSGRDPAEPTSPGSDAPPTPPELLDLLASARLDGEAEPELPDLRGAARWSVTETELTDADVVRRLEEFRSVRDALRDEVVQIDPDLRDQMIATALDSRAVDSGEPDVPAAEVARLDVRSRRSPGRLLGLVAAGLLLVAAVGVFATVDTRSSLSGGDETADSGATTDVADSSRSGSSESSGAAADDGQGASSESELDGLASRDDAASSPASSPPDDLTTTTVWAVEATPLDDLPLLGEYSTYDELLLIGIPGFRSDATSGAVTNADRLDGTADESTACSARSARSGLQLVARATVASRHVLVATSPSGDAAAILDLSSCEVLARG